MKGKRATSDPSTGQLVAGSFYSQGAKKNRSIGEIRALEGGFGKETLVSEGLDKQTVALYLRVSGRRSVESNLSIPEQESQLKTFCKLNGYKIVATYIEPGKSAKTTNRPQFRMMVDDAQAIERPFSKILIWTTSRFARSSKDYAIVEHLLQSRGIEVLSVSQSFAKDAGGLVAKRVTMMFDEYHSHRSAEDSINARRQMVHNGYWPGGRPPDGYELIASPSNAARKIAKVDEVRRPVIERIFTLCLHGDGIGSPLGVKAIAHWLNRQGISTREGSRWGVQAIHRVLTNAVYIGNYRWGLNPAVAEFRKELEPILLSVPPIISKAMFDDVQLMLERRNPEMGKAKQVSSSLLLSGIACCAECKAAMTLRTGTGKGGIVYRYYYCGSANRGKLACDGPKIPEEQLNEAVLTAVRARVLAESHLKKLLTGLQKRERLRSSSASEQLPVLKARLSAAESAISGLIASIRIAPALESDALFQDSLQRATEELTAARTRLSEALEMVGDTDVVSDSAISHFREQMIGLLSNENSARTKIYLSTIVESVEVSPIDIRIVGHTEDLKIAVANCAEDGAATPLPPVRRYVRRWRTGRDSNPRYGFPYTHFPGVRLQPLGHLSGALLMTSGRASFKC